MRHDIPVQDLGPYALPMAQAVEACVHCGFCLPACPTYQVMEEETESPRGRIILMKEVLEGNLALADAAPHLDACLGCLACVTACPSGVQYGELLTPFRLHTENQRKRTPLDRLLRQMILLTLPHPGRFRLAARLGRFAKPVAPLLPGKFREMLKLLPDRLPPQARLQEHYPAVGEQRARVALLTGCAQQVLEPGINLATISVLVNNGVEVFIPRKQGCCGALAAHTGVQQQAQAAARRNLDAFPEEVDAIISNAAGCGSGMHEYPLWLRGEPEEDAARNFSAKVQDVSVFLARLGLRAPTRALERPLRVAYHDACHLSHGQGVTREPRELLQQIDGVELVELRDPGICCGSAGTYNIEQPATAAELGSRKAAAVLETEADVVVTGNIGCLQQLAAHLPAGQVPVLHTMQLLARSYG
jgi:glycolate oxidase iron-sulfur subunit